MAASLLIPTLVTATFVSCREIEPINSTTDSTHVAAQSNRGQRRPRTWKSPVEISVTGRKFHWQFVHSGDDGVAGNEDDIDMGEQLFLPADTGVKLTLHSDDYMYIFSCPTLELREIAIPDLVFEINFTTGRAGAHDLVVDPLCGFRLRHDESMGRLTILSRDQFESWLTEKVSQ